MRDDYPQFPLDVHFRSRWFGKFGKGPKVSYILWSEDIAVMHYCHQQGLPAYSEGTFEFWKWRGPPIPEVEAILQMERLLAASSAKPPQITLGDIETLSG